METVDKAELLGRKRARLLLVMGVLLLVLEGASLAVPRAPLAPLGPADLVALAGWVFVAAACLFALMTGAGYGYGARVRQLANDEVTRAHRDAGVRAGFAAAMLAGLALCVAASLAPVDAARACHLVVTAGLAAGLIRFGLLEGRAHRLG